MSEKLAKYGELIMLWILCMVCTSATAYIYLSEVINPYTILGVVMSAAVILFIEFARKKKFGGLLYAAVLFCVCLVPAFTINSFSEMIEFIRWFFSGSEAVETKFDFIFTLTVLMCFLFTSAAYYFIKLIYRSSVITLISLIPFALAVKTVTAMPYVYPAIVAAVNIIIFIYNARKNLLSGAKPKGKNTLIVYTDFTVAVILLALLLPKPSVTPYYENFKELTDKFQIGGSEESRYTGEYRNVSGNTDVLRRGESVLLYIVSTDSPVYMKTQVFDVYDYEKGGWIEATEMTGDKNWQEDAPLLSYEKLGTAVEKALEASPTLSEYYPQAEKLIGLTENESYSLIYTQNYPAVYVLAPLRATGASLSSIQTRFNARTEDGEIFTNLYFLPEAASYTVRYYTEDMFDKLVEQGLCDVTFEDYGTALWNMWFYLYKDENDEERKVVSEFYNQHSYAEEYAEASQMEIPEEIQALADELTKGLEYDYQKAQAIERYFYSNGFRYDLNYEPPEESDTPEYFLFESKRGICSDFATAYTLLAKASGLTVRYVEGFVMQKSESNDSLYYIYTDNAHAYPEVYIPGAGWVVFEPTPADLTASRTSAENQEERTDPLAILFTAIIAVVVIGIFILLIIFAPKIAEGMFRIKVRFSDNSKALILLYNRHAVNMERKFGESCKALTPEQLMDYTESRTALSLEPLIKPFVKTCYGRIKLDKSEKENAFNCYRMQYKAIRKIKRRKD